MEFDIFLGVAALVIAAVLTWCILRFFFAPRRGGARATLHDGVQQATITVRGGYSPDIVTMQAGIPITLRFDRKETGECTSHVVFPDLGTDTMLPGNETTEMSLPPLPAGDYPFACGMNMVHGLLRVEGETDSATKPDDGTASTGTAYRPARPGCPPRTRCWPSGRRRRNAVRRFAIPACWWPSAPFSRSRCSSP